MELFIRESFSSQALSEGMGDFGPLVILYGIRISLARVKRCHLTEIGSKQENIRPFSLIHPFRFSLVPLLAKCNGDQLMKYR